MKKMKLQDEKILNLAITLKIILPKRIMEYKLWMGNQKVKVCLFG